MKNREKVILKKLTGKAVLGNKLVEGSEIVKIKTLEITASPEIIQELMEDYREQGIIQ